MALKKKITKEEHEKLAAHFKGEYVEDADGGYRLDVEGEEDTGTLLRAKARETELRKAAETELNTLRTAAQERQAELDKLTSDEARKNGDIKTLESAWAKDKETAVGTERAKVERLQQHLSKTLVDGVAIALAGKLSSKAPALLLPHIKARLKADFEGDEPVTRFLDADGKVNPNLTQDALYNEFLANKDFASILTVSKASGGAGADKNGVGDSKKFDQSGNQPANLSAMSPQQLADHIKATKETAQE